MFVTPVIRCELSKRTFSLLPVCVSSNVRSPAEAGGARQPFCSPAHHAHWESRLPSSRSIAGRAGGLGCCKPEGRGACYSL